MPHFNLRFVLLFLTSLSSAGVFAQGLEIYLAKALPDLRESATCHYCFELTDDILANAPLVEESDIEFFDWDTQTIKLNAKCYDKIQKLDAPLQGLAAAVVVDGKPIYGFWLWNPGSSLGCDRVYAHLANDLKLKFGQPDGHASGEDPRFENRIRDVIRRDNLMR